MTRPAKRCGTCSTDALHRMVVFSRTQQPVGAAYLPSAQLRITRRELLRAGVALVTLAVGGCKTPLQEPAQRKIVRLASGMPGAGFQPLGMALADAYERALPGILIELQESPGGSVRNAQAIQRAQADIGFVFADVTYFASIGQLKDDPTPFDQLRGIAVIELTPLHVVVRDERIRTVSDLRGRRVGIGPSGSGTELISDVVLRAYGVEPDELKTEVLPFADISTRFLEGTLDAAFVSAGCPAEAVKRATDAGAHLLALADPSVRKLRSGYPFLRLTFIPGGTYAGHPHSIPTIGVDNLLICRADLSEQLIYELTKGLFEAIPNLSSERLTLQLMDVERAPATPVPLHKGAARYYRERELTR